MTGPIRRRATATVTDARQARLLTDPRSAGFIHPFLGEERSTAEAAVWAACPLTTMGYRVRVLLEAGLLEVTRTRRRPGRSVTCYRSTHDAYRVPLAATGFTDHQDQARRIGAPVHRRIVDAYSHALLGSGTSTRLIARDEAGGILTTDLPPGRTRRRNPLLFEDRVVELTREQAEWLCGHLERTLEQLAEDQAGRGPGERQRYAVMVAAVPLEE